MLAETDPRGWKRKPKRTRWWKRLIDPVVVREPSSSLWVVWDRSRRDYWHDWECDAWRPRQYAFESVANRAVRQHMAAMKRRDSDKAAWREFKSIKPKNADALASPDYVERPEVPE